MTDRIAYLDFEASALPPESDHPESQQFSYPISIGIAPDSTKTTKFYRLIRPTDEWTSNGLWDPKSESIHKITLQTLDRAPTVDMVAHELKEYLTRQKITHIYISHRADDYWARILSKASKYQPFASVRFQDMTEIYYTQIDKVIDAGIPIELALSAFDLQPSLKSYEAITHNALDDATRQRHIFRRFLNRTNAVIENKKCKENTILRALIADPTYQNTGEAENADYKSMSKITGYSEKYLKNFLKRY